MAEMMTTDVRVAPGPLDRALRAAVDKSFNRISVDGDMSTNDTVLVLANGLSGYEVHDDETLREFTEALTVVATDLARQIARDGEGATKFVEVVVTGARSESDAVRVAKAIANSALVKTALYGNDANWGRVLAAAGYSGVDVDPSALTLWFGDVQLAANGAPADYDEAAATHAVSGAEVAIRLELGMGHASATVWTCDLSHDYVTINGAYRT
jgi:glutamate N-acetyltransferase/amino-acid N-acetyltransferase